MTFDALWQKWRKFWFEPKSALPICIFRILVGLISIQNAWHTWPGFLSWYGVNGVVSIDNIVKHNWEGLPRFDLILMLPPSDAWLLAFFAAYVVATFFLTIGFCTRYSAAFMALSLISFHHHNVFNANGGDAFQRLALVFLTFSHADACLSLDALLKRRRGGTAQPALYSPWAQRMLQVQVSMIYCDSFWNKVVHSEWLDGTAVYYATRIDDLIRFPMSFLLDNLLALKLLAWGTLAVEFSMWTLIWFRKTRYFALAAATLFHLGIDTAMSIPVFEWIMIASYVNFIEPEDLSRLALWVKEKAALLGKLGRSSFRLKRL
jgi:hypothetical protein